MSYTERAVITGEGLLQTVLPFVVTFRAHALQMYFVLGWCIFAGKPDNSRIRDNHGVQAVEIMILTTPTCGFGFYIFFLARK
mgnify:CR=1 FL=1